MEHVKGTRALIRRLDAVAKAVDESSMRDWQIRTVKHARDNTLPNKKTGMTHDSIQPGRRDRREAVVEVGGAGVFLEFGTKAHPIRPKYKKMLAWSATAAGRRKSGALSEPAKRGTILGRGNKSMGGMTIRNVGGRSGPASGPVIFAREVHHPGTKPYPFMVPAADKAAEEVFGVGPIVKAWNEAG